uniref:Uncharacterized protein n=1 Tax=Utricularia reniformis TaxID=192314 RepID=A0A1Y0B192_9LAMI|nr:hypothetical protein AEK19_MT0933 [Utricularia reniformis]ART31157.1 hypothetical protein AEK19_MT0933 [Utricularia reniformis]
MLPSSDQAPEHGSPSSRHACWKAESIGWSPALKSSFLNSIDPYPRDRKKAC